ncbi:MAG: cysteine synthase A [Clostridiales bacterium]|nr:cysteine synthase A [Clostridiales bacterium]
MNIATSIDQLIGNTPLIRLTRLEQKLGLQGQLLAKLEYFNPGGSIKDRAALQMLRAAEQAGRIGPGALIIEPTSGNTGIGLCMLCAARGYRAIIVVPETASIERIKLMRAYGAQVVLTPGSAGMRGAVERAEALARENENAFIPSQFDNPENANAHYLTTGPEIWAQTEGHVDALVAGVGTGGTITGIGRYLRERKPDVQLIAVEPASSPLLSQGHAGPHKIQGIGANFVPAVLDRSLLSRVQTVENDAAFAMMHLLAETEGVFCGISSGAAVSAAAEVLREDAMRGKTVVAILPDTGERYLSCL